MNSAEPHFSQGSNGRDHNPFGFSVWMAGGGCAAGSVYERLMNSVTTSSTARMDIYDLWATVLHLMGLDHEDLTYRHAGRDVRLSDVEGHVVKELIG